MNKQQLAPHEYGFPIRGDKEMSVEDTQKIRERFIKISVKKNEVLLKEGEVAGSLYFILKGVVRTYYLTAHGSEKTRYIGFEGSFITGLASFISRKPSFEWVDVLEDTELLVISHADFYALTDEIEQLNKHYRYFIEQAYIHQNHKVESLVTQSARQRYENLLKEKPHFIQRLSNKVLASYLDVTPETLSRLKAK
ncbi:MAG: Crp/Fnr family transcriptional regulator [Bacteroidota bacterium]